MGLEKNPLSGLPNLTIPHRLGKHKLLGSIHFGRNSGGGTLSSPEFLTENLANTYASVIGFGHSIMAGSYASDQAHQFIQLFGASKSATVLNAGIGGTFLQNTPSAQSFPNPTTDNGRDRFQHDTITGTNSTVKKEVLVCMYLINEARSTADFSAGVSAANYKNDLQECMNGWIIGGYRPNKIILSNDCWVTDSRLNNTAIPQTRAGYEEFVTATKEVADEYGVFFADTYNYMKNNGGDSLINGGDSPPLHPGDTGHAAIATSIGQAIRTYTAINNIRMAGNSSGELTITFDSVAGAVSYDVQCDLRSAVTFNNTANVTTNSKTFTGLANGDYVCRVRAVYGNGQKGSWNFQIAPTTVGTTLFILDTFSDTADGTAITSHINGETGHTWTLQPNATAPATPVQISDGRIRATNASGSVYQASTTPASADYDVTTWIETRSALTTGQCGPAGRMQANADTYYYARYTESSSTPTFSLFKRVNGSNSQIGSNYTAAIPLNGIAKLTLRMQGSTISLLVDDVVKITGTSTSITTAGKAGVRLAGATSPDTGCQITAFQAKAL